MGMTIPGTEAIRLKIRKLLEGVLHKHLIYRNGRVLWIGVYLTKQDGF